MWAPSSTPIDASNDIAAVKLAVRAEALARGFGRGVRALAGVDLAIPAGELVALIGANGSGKSTLLKILFGIILPDEGSVRVLGMEPRRERLALRCVAGYAGQDVALDPEISGRETLDLFHALRGLPHADREHALARLAGDYGLEDFLDRLVGTYSGGERQRLHVALETMHAPRLLRLDEPTTSLDPSGRRALWNRLEALRDAGCTVIAATHDLNDAAARCDRVILLGAGKLLAEGPPADLVAGHGAASTVIVLARAPGEDAEPLGRALAALPGSPEVTIDGPTITLRREAHPIIGEPALELLAAWGIPYLRHERQERDLASAYFRLGGRPLEPLDAPRARRGGGNRRR
jgi:ABC-type multidrug transport system ATPase subunit